MAEDDLLPDVRVGMAHGRVISRLGDVFGTTVNRASRLTAVARPAGSSSTTRSAPSLASLSGFQMTAPRRRYLRGIGQVTPSELHRARGEWRTTPKRGPPMSQQHRWCVSSGTETAATWPSWCSTAPRR